jgi:hypothetical protein
MNPTINGRNVSYIAWLDRARRRGDALRQIIPDAGVTGNGSVLFKGRVIGTFTMLGEDLVDRKGNAAPVSDPAAVRAWFRRAA